MSQIPALGEYGFTAECAENAERRIGNSRGVSWGQVYLVDIRGSDKLEIDHGTSVKN